MNNNPARVDVLDRTDFYTTNYACANSTAFCTSIVETDTNVQIIFSNGLTIIFLPSTININEIQVVTWLSASISLVDINTDFSDKLVGLMGNYNGKPDDDVSSRTGTKPNNLNSEKLIYDVANTWQLGPNDADLFSPDPQKTAKAAISFSPSFLEDIVASNTDPELNKTCNYVLSCVADALVSGLTKFGQATGSTLTKNIQSTDTLSITPPKIEFKNTSIRIDWSNISPITLVVEITSYGTNNPITQVDQNFQNAADVTVNFKNPNTLSRTYDIVYKPKIGEYPIFE